MSLFEELKRRNVIRVGIAYAVGGWLLLQLTDVLSELLNLPEQVGPTVVILVALGFPIVLFLAWAFELTPQGVKRESEVDRSISVTHRTGKKLNGMITVMLAIAVAFLLLDKFYLQKQAPGAGVDVLAETTEAAVAEPVATQAALEEAPEVSRQSIAVLPFTNRSRNEDDQYFVEGVHDDLLTNLARIGSLKVISRTSVMRYTDTEIPIPTIAKELGVATIMEGAVQRSGDKVRINVQLIDANTDEHLWAEIYDRELTAENLFEIQSEISRAIADALQTTLSPEEQERISLAPTENLLALDAFQRGRQLVATRREANLEQAIKQFQKAVELDPQFALAWVELADANNLFSEYGNFSRAEATEVIEDAFERVMAIDPNLGEAYASIAQAYEYRGQYEEMEAAFLKAIELSPNYARAYHWYANSLGQLFPLRTREILDLAQTAMELDPQAAIISNNLANAYAARGLYSLAEQQFRRTLELNPEWALSHRALAGTYGEQGRFDLALKEFRAAAAKEPGAPNNIWQGFPLIQLDALAEAAQFMEQVALEHPDDPRTGYMQLMINARQGNLQAVRETAAWLLPRVESDGAGFGIARALLASGDTQEALDIFQTREPGWRQAAAWEQLISQWPDLACLVAFALLDTGETEQGSALLAQATRVHKEVLPTVHEHPGVFSSDVCYMAAGDPESALAEIERRVEHGHVVNFWLEQQLTLFEPLKTEPRYQAAWQKYQQRLADQRQALGIEGVTGP